MATASMGIIISCGMSSFSEEVKDAIRIFREYSEVLVIITEDMFVPTLEKAGEAFAEISKMLGNVLVVEKTPYPSKWYNPTDCHNYRKMHRITPRRIVKRRDRQSRGSIKLLKVDCAEDSEEE